MEAVAGPAEVRRIGNRRAAVIGAIPTSFDLGGLSSRIEDALLEVRAPAGYEIELAGQKREMEQALGMPDGALQETVAKYNEHAAKGEDPEFHKKDKWLQPLDNAPYAALDASVGAATYMSFTLGGLDVTIDGEVKTETGGTVPGLFAIGGCASNIAQDGTGYSSGTCIGESTFFGRRAGEAAAAS